MTRALAILSLFALVGCFPHLSSLMCCAPLEGGHAGGVCPAPDGGWLVFDGPSQRWVLTDGGPDPRIEYESGRCP